MKKLSISIIALSSVFGFTSVVIAEDCTPAPDCASLGFTQNAADCVDGGIQVACPTDPSKVFCEAKVAILYGDGTVASGLVTGKTPIGIVFDTANRLAVALTDINSSGSAGSTTMNWSANYYDIPALGNCASSTNLATCRGGRANTTAMLNCSSSCGLTPAAIAANCYEPSGCSKDFCKKTKWFLPSIGDLITLYKVKDSVNALLSLTSSSRATVLKEVWYWSSSEYNDIAAWALYLNDGRRSNSYKTDTNYVRLVVKY